MCKLILAAVRSAIDDQAQDIVRSAAVDFDKKETEMVFGIISNEQFSQFVSLSMKFTDYNADDETIGDYDKDVETDEGGVAVVLTRRSKRKKMRKISRSRKTRMKTRKMRGRRMKTGE